MELARYLYPISGRTTLGLLPLVGRSGGTVPTRRTPFDYRTPSEKSWFVRSPVTTFNSCGHRYNFRRLHSSFSIYASEHQVRSGYIWFTLLHNSLLRAWSSFVFKLFPIRKAVPDGYNSLLGSHTSSRVSKSYYTTTKESSTSIRQPIWRRPFESVSP